MSPTALLAILATLLLAESVVSIFVRYHRRGDRATQTVDAKRVRVYTKPMPDGSDDTIDGTLVGLRAGHYVLIHAMIVEAVGAEGTPLDGEVWLPTENVRTIQVLQLT